MALDAHRAEWSCFRHRTWPGVSETTYQGTVLAVVHDHYFIQRLATGIWAIEEGTVRGYVDLEDMRRGKRQQM